MDGISAFLQKWRVKLGHVFALVIIAFAEPSLSFLIAGTVVSLLGEAIRIYSAGTIVKDEKLTRSGPYAFTRNPLYLGSFFMSLGFCIAAGNIYVLAAFFVFFFSVYYATILREETFLSRKFGEDFETFRREVPRFLPRLSPLPGAGHTSFDWAQVSRNKEYEGLAATLAILAILWAMGLSGWDIPRLLGLT